MNKEKYRDLVLIFSKFWEYEKYVDDNIRFYGSYARCIPQSERNELFDLWTAEKLKIDALLNRYQNEVGLNYDGAVQWLIGHSDFTYTTFEPAVFDNVTSEDHRGNIARAHVPAQIKPF